MGIVAAYAVPHPPLIIPSVGRGQELAISDTIAAFEEVARRIALHDPETIVIISPHAPAYRDGFFISKTDYESGSMADFGCPQDSMQIEIDVQLADAIADRMDYFGVSVVGDARFASKLDHATFVPLHFIAQAMSLSDVKVVRIGLSGLPDADHKLLGRAISEAAYEIGRKTVLVASGDWSHKLKEDGPYGFVPEGPAFDSALAEIFRRGDLEALFAMDPAMCEEAAECGLRSFEIMAGALEGCVYTSELLSYEGPFGVGYGIAAFEVDTSPDSTDEGVDYEIKRAQVEELAEAAAETGMAHVLQSELLDDAVDPLIALARATVDLYITTGEVQVIPSDFPEEYINRRAGAFVSLHEHGQLRGCLGTISPTKKSIAEEVIANAISAATSDPRFPAVAVDELVHLSYSVDVLGEPERVDSLIELDPKRYGVIVTRGSRRGLLLPDLDGVDTVMDQIAIAKRKAGIAANEDVEVARFEVIRHTLGGEAQAD